MNVTPTQGNRIVAAALELEQAYRECSAGDITIARLSTIRDCFEAVVSDVYDEACRVAKP